MRYLRTISRFGLATLFIGAGVLHFVKPAPFVRIVPPYLPAPRLLVAVSGAAEIAGGAGLLLPATRQLATGGLLALLVAVFPANVHMAQHNDTLFRLPAWAVWGRLPLQALLLAGVWWVGKPPR